MNRYILVLISIFFYANLYCQTGIHIKVGLQTIYRNVYNDKIFRGGNNLVYGIEIDQILLKNEKRQLSFATGVTHFKNEFQYDGFLQVSEESTVSQTCLQTPFVIRYSFNPFPLINRFQIYIGSGIESNYILNHKIREWALDQFQVNNFIYSFEQDIKGSTPKFRNFYRIEFGARYKNFLFQFSYSKSLKNYYIGNFEELVPEWESIFSLYPRLHRSQGYKERFITVSLGYLLFYSKKSVEKF